MRGYPKWFNAKFISTFCLASLVSGCLLFPSFLNFKMEWDVPWYLPTDQRTWVVALHLVFGFSSFMILGALSSIHMRLGWRKKEKVKSGASLVILTLLLGLTGVSILYAGNESLSFYSSLLHFFLGLALGTAYVVHLLMKVVH